MGFYDPDNKATEVSIIRCKCGGLVETGWGSECPSCWEKTKAAMDEFRREKLEALLATNPVIIDGEGMWEVRCPPRPAKPGKYARDGEVWVIRLQDGEECVLAASEEEAWKRLRS